MRNHDDHLQLFAHSTSALAVVAAASEVVLSAAAARASKAERARRFSFMMWSRSCIRKSKV